MPFPAPDALRRTDYDTSDPETAREFIDQAYGGRLQLSSPDSGHWRVSLTQVDAGVICASDLGLAGQLSFGIEGRDQYVFTSMVDGAASFDYGKNDDRYRSGDVYLSIAPRSRSSCRTLEVRAQTITLPATLITQAAASSAAEPGTAVTFVSHRPAGDGARRWRNTVQLLDALLTDPGTAGSPLLITSAAQLVAAVALAVFPNTAVIDPTRQDRRDAGPETLRLAVAFIDDQAHTNITIADVAAAASVTSRAVQLAFRRHLDTTPTGYLRRVRLDHAHQDLQLAGPGDGLTVTAIAYRWGFPTVSRFAAYYRRAYGVTPSYTLRN